MIKFPNLAAVKHRNPSRKETKPANSCYVMGDLPDKQEALLFQICVVLMLNAFPCEDAAGTNGSTKRPAPEDGPTSAKASAISQFVQLILFSCLRSAVNWYNCYEICDLWFVSQLFLSFNCDSFTCHGILICKLLAFGCRRRGARRLVAACIF